MILLTYVVFVKFKQWNDSWLKNISRECFGPELLSIFTMSFPTSLVDVNNILLLTHTNHSINIVK